MFLPQPRCLCLPHFAPTRAGETISADYVTEYSTDRIEMHTGAVQPGQRVLLIDDLIATGGTLGKRGTDTRDFCSLGMAHAREQQRWGRCALVR